MIPQPLKWVGAIVVLVIFVAAVAPMAYESLVGMVTFSDEGGLISGGDDALDEAEAQEAEAADDEGVEEPTEEPTERPDSYVVESGDTLFSIALEIFGDGSRWVDIAEANDMDLDGADGITAGQELVIP